ncbi:MAG: sugar transferase [Alphaproteobacteria bacterium]|nr:MAG: sugar transferase [Alphaproteobacteria bacterium]
MKNMFDRIFSFLALTILSPLLFTIAIVIYLTDFHSPFYVANRVGLNGKLFPMIKFRSMRKGADKTGVDSTSANDTRITPIGHFIRRYKIDELSQLINVFIGTMSLVGPRPNVKRETDLYTKEEKEILTVKPGITDLSSIVFSDEGNILADEKDPDLAYNQLIRPWKSRLGIFYINHRSVFLDFYIIWLTVLNFFNRQSSLNKIYEYLRRNCADQELYQVVLRKEKLVPTAPPGATEIVRNRS